MRKRFVYRPDDPAASENGFIEVDESYLRSVTNSSAYYIPDEMAPTRHMADGQMYTSKRIFRQVTRRHGCIEVGNETATVLKPRKTVEMDRGKRRDDIRRAIRGYD